MAQASAAAGRDEMLPLLTGVRLELEGSTISLMATDRFRASLRDLQWYPEKADLSAQALVPARVLGETARSLTAGGDVTIAVASGEAGDGLIGFEGTVGNGTRRTTTRLLEGDFPRVRQLFQAQAETVAYVDTHAFVDSVKRVALVAERNTPVRLTFAEASCCWRPAAATRLRPRSRSRPPSTARTSRSASTPRTCSRVWASCPSRWCTCRSRSTPSLPPSRVSRRSAPIPMAPSAT